MAAPHQYRRTGRPSTPQRPRRYQKDEEALPLQAAKNLDEKGKYGAKQLIWRSAALVRCVSHHRAAPSLGCGRYRAVCQRKNGKWEVYSCLTNEEGINDIQFSKDEHFASHVRRQDGEVVGRADGKTT